MNFPYLQSVLLLLISVWFSEAKQRKKDLEKVLHEVIASLLLDERLDRHPRSNDSVSSDLPTTSSSTSTSSIYNYWMLPSNTPTTTEPTTTTPSTSTRSYWQDRMTSPGSVASNIEKLRDQIRYQALVKKTNQEFIAFLNKVVEDKKIELNEEDKEIRDEYAELNRTREALFRAYNRQLPDRRLEELRRKLAEKETEYRELMSMHRLRRWSREVQLDTPWININYPGGIIRKSLRRKKSKNEFYESEPDVLNEASSVVNNPAKYAHKVEDYAFEEDIIPKKRHKGVTKRTEKVTTMSVGEILWKSLGKYLPFGSRNLANFAASIPLEVHYRVGRDVAHITIKVGDPDEPTTLQFIDT